MKYYVIKKENHMDILLLSEVPENIGYDKIDYENGRAIELPEELVEQAQDMLYYPKAFDLLFPLKYYYIKDGKVIDLYKELNPELYKIGETYEDYLKGMFVLLNEEQAHYYLHHRGSSIYLIWNLGLLPEPESPTLEEVKTRKLQELALYDVSKNVNSFTINEVIPAWFTPTERTNYALSVLSAKNLGVDTLTFAVGNNVLEVATDKAEMMLSAIQLYADACYMVTKQHELAIQNLDTIEAINGYDITAGYPEKLNFDLV